MPLVRGEVRNVYGATEVYREANREEPTEILQGVAIASLVGLLRQLGDLSDFAAQVFHGLQEELGRVSSRSRMLKSRIRRVQAALPPLEKVVLAQRSHLHFAYVPGCDWRARKDCKKHKFVYTDVPEYVLDSYEECPEPPRLHLLDKFDSGGPGSCFKRYSDPLFFEKASKDLQVKKNKKGVDRNRSSVQRPCIEHNLLDAVIADARYGVQNDLMPALGGSSSWYIPWVCNSEPEFVDVDFDDFEDEKDAFMDAPYAMEPDQNEIDIIRMRERDAQQTSKLEVIQPNLESRDSESIANRSLIFGDRCNPISMSLKSSFAAFCCISAKERCDSMSNSYRNWGTSSLDRQKPVSVTSDFAPISIWRNNGLLGVEQSKPAYSSLLNDLENQDKIKSCTYQENKEKSSSFRTVQFKISASELGINLERTIGLVHQNNTASFAKTESRRVGFDRTKDQSAPELTIASPPLRPMKIPFQPIDGFEVSTLKLKLPCGIANGGRCTDVLPLFQLVPEVSIARQDGGSDSDDDTFYMPSPSLSDGNHSNEVSESDSEQGKSPTEQSLDLMELNYSFTEESRNDTNSPIPPIVWYNVEPNLDFTFHLNEESLGQREAKKEKVRDEKEHQFLQLIRSKSLNLSPTTATKPAAPSNIHTTTILKKANSVRQAVGSDEAEDGGNWTNH